MVFYLALTGGKILFIFFKIQGFGRRAGTWIFKQTKPFAPDCTIVVLKVVQLPWQNRWRLGLHLLF